MQRLDEASYKALGGIDLEKRMVMRLIQEGFATVAPGASAELTLIVSTAPDGVLLEAKAVNGSVSREVPRGLETLIELHLEAAQKAVDLAREAFRTLVPPPAVTAALAPAPSPAHRGPDITLGASALWRQGAVDPLVRLGLRLPMWQRFGFHLLAGLAKPDSQSIHVFEPELQVGAGYELPLGATWSIEAALTGGVLLHLFSLKDASSQYQEAAGYRVDLLASLPLALIFKPTPAMRLGLCATPGIASRGRDHLLEGESIYRRGAFRLEVGATLGWSP